MRLLRNPLVLAVLVTGAGVVVWVTVFPRVGTDLSAHVARAGWAMQYPGAGYLFSWYGGIYPASYSLLTPYLLAAVGVHTAMAGAAVASAALLALLMVRHRVPRPRAAALWGAAAVCTELTAGRAAFTLGLAAGLASVAVADAGRPRRWMRLAGAGSLAVLSSLLSPVTGLFLGLPAAAYLLTGRSREGLVIAAGAGLPLAAAAVFADGGVQPIDARNAVPSLLAVVLVLVLVPWRWRLLRTGAVLYGLAVIVVWAVPTPVGSNIERLASLLAGPVLAGMAEPRLASGARAAVRVRGRWLVPLLAAGLLAAAGWQVTQPALDLGQGNGPPYVPETAALVRELGVLRADTARVEAVPQYGHWESQQLASAVPLARGWERQLDMARNPLFYQGVLTPGGYYAWLLDNAVRYVAISTAAPDFAAVAEADIVRAGEPWLVPVWHNAFWSLYQVAGAEPLASGPAAVIASTPATITLRMSRAGTAVVRVRWSPLLRACPGGALARHGIWTSVTMPHAGTCALSAPY